MWRFAGHVARRDDDRWSTAITEWIPKNGHRDCGRPKTRWSYVLDTFFTQEFGVSAGVWQGFAQDREAWSRYEDKFVSHFWQR